VGKANELTRIELNAKKAREHAEDILPAPPCSKPNRAAAGNDSMLNGAATKLHP